MAITAVSGQFVATSGTSATAIAGTLPNAPTPGNILVAMVDCAGAVTPTATGAWTKLTQIQSTDTGALFWKIVPASDPAAQTLTSAGTGSSWGVVIQEFTGAAASPLLVQNNQASTTTSKVSPSVSPTASVEALIIGGAFSDGSRTWSTSAFTGTNVGSVTNVGTGSRGTTAAGESATLWYAEISSTSGSYTGTITCSAADGGGAAVAVFLAAPARSGAGAQPSGSGTLGAARAYTRSLTGSQPILIPVTYADPTVTYAQLDVYYTGRSPGRVTAEEAVGVHYDRTVAGAQPAGSGTLTRRLAALRSLAGAQPAGSGTLTRQWAALRSLAGAQPSGTGALVRRLTALRTLAGAQPTALGTLTRRLGALRSLAGAQLPATGTLGALSVRLRSVAGAQPAGSGTLTRQLGALRSLAGAVGAGLGSLARSIVVSRTLTGAPGAPTGALANDASLARELAASQPPATGTLSAQKITTRAVAGAIPTATGTLAAQKVATRALTGAQPAASGTLGRSRSTARALTGAQPAGTATLIRRLGAPRALAGAQAAASGLLTALRSVARALSGAQPAATGVLTRAPAITRSLTGAQPTATGTLTAQKIVAYTRTLSGFQPVTLPVLYDDPSVVYDDPDVTYGGARSPGQLTRIAATHGPPLTSEQPEPSGTLRVLLQPVITTVTVEYTLGSSQGLWEHDLGYQSGDSSVEHSYDADESLTGTTTDSARELVTTVGD